MKAHGREWLVVLACLLAFVVVVMVRPAPRSIARGRPRPTSPPALPATAFPSLVYGVASRPVHSDAFEPYSYWRLDHVRSGGQVTALGFGRVCEKQGMARASVGQDVLVPLHEVPGGLALQADGAVLLPRDAGACAPLTLSDDAADADGSVWGVADPYSGLGGSMYSRLPGRLPERNRDWEGDRRTRIACEPDDMIETPAGRLVCRVLRYERGYRRRGPPGESDTVDVAGRAWIAPGIGLVRSVERVSRQVRSRGDAVTIQEHVVERRAIELVAPR